MITPGEAIANRGRTAHLMPIPGGRVTRVDLLGADPATERIYVRGPGRRDLTVAPEHLHFDIPEAGHPPHIARRQPVRRPR